MSLEPILTRLLEALEDGDTVYVGQARVFARRMYQEGKERMSGQFADWHAIPCPLRELNEREREWIAAFRPPLNRTEGNR